MMEKKLESSASNLVSLATEGDGMRGTELRPRRASAPPPQSLQHAELFHLLAELPVAYGEDVLLRAFCNAIHALYPSFAVGVVVTAGREDGQDRTYLAGTSSYPWLERDDTSHPTSSTQPTVTPSDGRLRRLFAASDDERALRLPLPFASHSLHLASTGPAEGLALGLLESVAERVALILYSALLTTRRLDAARGEGLQLRDIQAKILQTEKLASVGQVAAKVVHELNNPLTAIVTYSAFLTKKLERAGHDAADVERLRRIGESADRILRFSRDLTAYARPQDETPGPVAINDVVERAIVFCEHIIAEHSIGVTTKLDPSLSAIPGMRGQLTQVFVNLITNACHAVQDAARGDEGAIEICATSREDGGVRVTVADNGLGISSEHLVRIFDPFYTTKEAGRGTGLGLSIVRSIVEGHGGRIWVRSEPGHGSQFIVDFQPMARTPR